MSQAGLLGEGWIPSLATASARAASACHKHFHEATSHAFERPRHDAKGRVAWRGHDGRA